MLLRPWRTTHWYDTFWYFAAERQSIFWRRFNGDGGPWTDDEILQRWKFTNVYRVTDRTSQFLIREVINRGSQQPAEVFFRVVLFKIFNRISTWQLLQSNLGELTAKKFTMGEYEKILSNAISKNQRIYSAAYIMPPGQRGKNKHQAHLRLLQNMIDEDVPNKVQVSSTMAEVFHHLRSYPLVGNFLAYQWTIDLNYSSLTNFSEMDFVVAGPGAIKGLRHCFINFQPPQANDIIRWIAEHQDQEFHGRQLPWRNLFGRPLQLVDIQNIFCELGKYIRMKTGGNQLTVKPKLKQHFIPHVDPIAYIFPSKWAIHPKMGA